MLESMIITFREGLEAFLIVAITLAYLTKTGRHNLIKPAWYGVGVALLISATTGYHIRELAENSLWEGTLAFIAGGLVASLTVYVMKTAKNIRQNIHARLEKQASQEGALAEIGIFAFTVLMISREGMETALMLGSMSGQTGGWEVLGGTALGVVLVGLIGLMWIRQSHRINLKLFLQVTGIFLVLFAIHLGFYGIHELSEIDALPFLSDNANMMIHAATEPFEPDQPYGQFVTYSLLVIPCAWLAASWLRGKFTARTAAAAE